MSYRISIDPEFNRSLRQAADYIAKDSVQNAAEFVQGVVNAIDRLREMPDCFKVVGRSRKSGSLVHSFVMRPYIIYYSVDLTHRIVSILDIRHGARRQPRRFD